MMDISLVSTQKQTEKLMQMLRTLGLGLSFFPSQGSDAWQGPADLQQYPVVNPDASPPPHLLFVDAAHLFILNPVIIVPLHWPAGKALRSSWGVN